MNIVIIDGQGGRMGQNIVERLIARHCPGNIQVVGTNSAATSAMLRAGVKQGATGENPVIVAAARADIIVGPMGIIAANALMGEITPAMAMAISESAAQKVLIPMDRCGIQVAGVADLPMRDYIELAADRVMALCQ